MDLQLSGKTVLITGSTAGIGYATAQLLLEEGAEVYINGRQQASTYKAVDQLKEEVPGARVAAFVADFMKPAEVEKQLSTLPSVDILINNVGIYTSKSFYTTSAEEWNSQFQVNIMSGVQLTKRFLPTMLQQNWGRILFISSECAYLVPSDMISYSATKAALHAVSKGLSHLTKGSQVTINTLVPGSTLTEGAKKFIADKAASEKKDSAEIERLFFQNERPHSLLERFAEVKEVATTIAYLCSPLSSATNGSVIKVDGGSSGGVL